jgi:hypothetical protein
MGQFGRLGASTKIIAAATTTKHHDSPNQTLENPKLHVREIDIRNDSASSGFWRTGSCPFTPQQFQIECWWMPD